VKLRLRLRQPRVVEQPEDQRVHAVRRRGDAGRPFARVVAEAPAVLQEDLGAGGDRAERRPEIVGDRVAEDVDLALRRLEPRALLNDPTFELRLPAPLRVPRARAGRLHKFAQASSEFPSPVRSGPVERRILGI